MTISGNKISRALQIDYRRARAARSEAEKGVTLTRLNRDGSPSRMHGATERFRTREEAEARLAYVRSLNPGRTLRYAIDGVEV